MSDHQGPPLLLCLNVGSTTLKAAAFAASGADRPPVFRTTVPLGVGVDAVFRRMADEPVAVVHRVVHSGPNLRGPVDMTAAVLGELREASSLAPLHQPKALELLAAASRRFSSARQVACFDTDFFADLPERATRLPVAEELRDQGVRRYGFHGLAHASVLHARPELREGRAVLCHLGGGCSLAALSNGEPVATSTGMTPTGGVFMAGRCGDLDPGAVLWLLADGRRSPQELCDLLNTRSGLRGLSGGSGDVSELLQDPGRRSRLAVSIYCDAIAEEAAGLAVRLGGLDRLNFSGGVGENQPPVRDAVVERLRAAGLLRDAEVTVTRCDEERQMARLFADRDDARPTPPDADRPAPESG